MAAPDAAADVTVDCRQGDLASLLMGSCDLEGLLRLGAATADDGEKAMKLARLLHWGRSRGSTPTIEQIISAPPHLLK